MTLSDVAAHAGVSRSSASLALRGTGRLSEETRERVQASMEALGYVYHRTAASLRTQKSSVVGFIVTDVSNPFFSSMSRELEWTLSKAGYRTMLSNTFDEHERFDDLVRTMSEYPVAALVYVPVADADFNFATSRESGVPGLAVTREPPVPTPFLGPDDLLGGRLAAQHLIDVHGRRRLVYLGGPETAGPRSRRIEGVRSAIDGSAAELVVQLPGVTGIHSGLALAERLVESGLAFDAVLCHSDVTAYALCHTLRSRGVVVPLDVSVVGFDGLDTDVVFAPTITSVSVDPARIGRLAADWVATAVSGGSVPERTVLAPVLEIRASCGCVDVRHT